MNSQLFPRRLAGVLTLALLLAWTVAPVAAQPPLPRELALGTHAVGTTYHAMGTGLAKVLSERSGIRITLKPFSGPGAWIPLMNRGDLELGVVSLNDVSWAYTGAPFFLGQKNPNLRLLVRGNWIRPVLGLVVPANSDIKRIADVRGKRVTSDFGANPIARFLVEAWLASGGLGWSDVRSVPVPGVSEAAAALRTGQVDVAFGATPTAPYMQELQAAVRLRALPFADVPAEKVKTVSTATLEKLRQLIPASELDVVEPDGKILKELYVSVKHPTSMVAAAPLTEAAAYQIVKTIWEHHRDLWPVHAWLKGWVPEQLFDPTPPIPYHDGAIRYWKEKGLWTPELEQRQQRLLAAGR